MIKKDLYKYVGRNGSIISLVHLDDAKYYPMYRLIADKDKVLTNGILKLKTVDIFVEDLNQWTEIQGQD